MSARPAGSTTGTTWSPQSIKPGVASQHPWVCVHPQKKKEFGSFLWLHPSCVLLFCFLLPVSASVMFLCLLFKFPAYHLCADFPNIIIVVFLINILERGISSGYQGSLLLGPCGSYAVLGIKLSPCKLLLTYYTISRA